MINGQYVLGVIPARGGSKGIPRKNIRVLGDKPLIAWTILEANKSKYIDRLIVSTDDKEIAEVATSWGAEVPFLRPAELATDTARGIDTIIHALKSIAETAVVVQLQPTSPFRIVTDIDGCLEQWAAHHDAVVTLTETSKPPEWMYSMGKDDQLIPVVGTYEVPTNRQALSTVYALNGAVYVASKEFVLERESFLTAETRGYSMPSERSIDLDTEEDWQYAEWKLERSGKQNG